MDAIIRVGNEEELVWEGDVKFTFWIMLSWKCLSRTCRLSGQNRGVEMPSQSPEDSVRGWKKRGRSTLTLSSDADSKTGRREWVQSRKPDKRLKGFHSKLQWTKDKLSSVSADQEREIVEERVAWGGRAVKNTRPNKNRSAEGLHKVEI